MDPNGGGAEAARRIPVQGGEACRGVAFWVFGCVSLPQPAGGMMIIIVIVIIIIIIISSSSSSSVMIVC